MIYTLGFQVIINMYFIVRSIVHLLRLLAIYCYNLYNFYHKKVNEIVNGPKKELTQEEKDELEYQRALAAGQNPVPDINIIKLTLAENDKLR